MNNRVRLDLHRPNGLFDSVEVLCPIDPEQILFNNTEQQASVDCSFLNDMPLMNFVILTKKQGFNSTSLSISQEGNSQFNIDFHHYSFSTFTDTF